ncbi:MAG: 50S ribosomal protein L3, partial [Gemmatimonadales bacterium]
MEGILGKKLGMTQIYGEDGTAYPVTVVKAGPCLVVQRKTVANDGYEAVQLGLVEEHPPRKATLARRGHFKKAGVPPMRRLAEFSLAEGEEANPGDQVTATIFAEKEYVDVSGTSKGKGYQGVVKRHGFRGGRASHG